MEIYVAFLLFAQIKILTKLYEKCCTKDVFYVTLFVSELCTCNMHAWCLHLDIKGVIKLTLVWQSLLSQITSFPGLSHSYTWGNNLPRNANNCKERVDIHVISNKWISCVKLEGTLFLIPHKCYKRRHFCISPCFWVVSKTGLRLVGIRASAINWISDSSIGTT